MVARLCEGQAPPQPGEKRTWDVTWVDDEGRQRGQVFRLTREALVELLSRPRLDGQSSILEVVQ